MRKFILLLFIGLLPSLLLAQKVKYKDVFPLIANASDEEAKYHLIRYIFSDLNHPNANLRLAMLYEKNYLETDVLTDYKRAMAFAQKCKLQYIKSKSIINEREVSRNEEYYVQFATSFDKKGRPTVEYSSVIQKMENGYDSAALFIEKLPPIYENFTLAVNHYGEAYNLFYEINNAYKSLDDLLMLYDDQLEKKLLLIKANMDSSLVRFQNYQRLIRDFPINNYRQRYTKQPIVHYRLDGLSAQGNFLQNDIILWDYSQWVDDIIKIHNAEIVNLRKEIVTLNNNLQKALQQLEEAKAAEDDNFVVPDKELVYQLNKYDFQSVVLGMIDYNSNKQGIIKKKKQKLFYDTATQLNIYSRLNFYSDLIRQQVKADSLLNNLKTRINEDKIAKHKDFIKNNYGGERGLNQFVTKEHDQGKKDFNFYKLTLRNDILNEINVDVSSKEEWVRFKRFDLPLFLNENDSASLANNSAITTAIDYRADSSLYIAGYMDGANHERKVGYLARLTPDRKVQWLQEIDISIDSGVVDASTRIVDIEITKDGCAAMARSAHETLSLNVNTFLYYEDNGTEKMNIRLASEAYPRKILYDQGNSRFICSLKGDQLGQDVKKEEEIFLVAYNTLGDKLWERQIELAGTYEDMLNLQYGYLIVGNFTKIDDLKGNTYRTKAQLNETNAFAIKVSNQGDVTDIAAFEKPQSYFVKKVYKVNDGNINLFGYEGSYNDSPGELSYNNDNLFHIMINRKLEEIELR